MASWALKNLYTPEVVNSGRTTTRRSNCNAKWYILKRAIVGWINVEQDRNQLRILVNTIMKFWVPQKAGNERLLDAEENFYCRVWVRRSNARRDKGRVSSRSQIAARTIAWRICALHFYRTVTGIWIHKWELEVKLIGKALWIVPPYLLIVMHQHFPIPRLY
jgi:hypothetical protein